MPKILNLDALSEKITRELVLNGKTYKIRETTVEDFIETTRAAEAIDIEKMTIGQQTEMTIDLIAKQIPDIARDDLMHLNLDQLQAVAAFVRGVDPEVIMAAVGGAKPADETAPAAEGDEAGKA